MTTKDDKHPIWSAENTRFLLYFLITVIVVYVFPKFGVPKVLIRMAFLAVLPIVFRTRDDVFWLSWFFLIMDSPGRLFIITSAETVFRLPYYSLAMGVSLGFPELFVLTYMLKYLVSVHRSNFIFARHFWLILFYGLGVLFFSPMISSTSLGNTISGFRMIMPWAWVLILPKFIHEKEQLIRAFKLLSPFVMLGLILTIQAQISGTYLHDVLSGEAAYGYLGEAEDQLVRVDQASHLLYICLMLALYYLSTADRRFNKTYLTMVLVMASVQIFLAATRGWIIGMVVLFISVFFMGGYNFIKQVLRLLTFFVLLFVIIGNIYPEFNFQSGEALARFMTVEQIAKGDVTAGGTLSRLSERGPKVMAAFSDSPVVGFGFSGQYYANMDGHVGNQNMLLQGGILGYTLWILIFIAICLKIQFLGRSWQTRGRMGNGSIIFLLAMLGSFAIHSSSGQIYGFYNTAPAATLHWAWILASASVYLRGPEPVTQPAIRSAERIAC